MELMGRIVKDRITGFKGRVTGHARYITGCDQFLVQPPTDEKGEFKDGRWIDEQRLTADDSAALELDNSEGTGADVAAPIK